MTHHPHVHCVVPGGGLSPDSARWIAGRPNFFLAVKPLARLFRRLFLERLTAAFDAGDPELLRRSAHPAEPAAFAAHLVAMRRISWVVYAKRPFGGPAQVLAYLGRYTHRVAIANSRLVALDDDHVAFTWKDYRQNGADKDHEAQARTSSSAASSFTRCPMASIASATSASWPTAAAPKRSRRAALCSPMKTRRRRTPARRRTLWTKTPSTPGASAQIAAEPCGSSSAFCPNSGDAGLPHRRFGATRHEMGINDLSTPLFPPKTRRPDRRRRR